MKSPPAEASVGEKLNAASRTEAVAIAQRRGLIPADARPVRQQRSREESRLQSHPFRITALHSLTQGRT
jgi:hypothetical protein